MTGSSTFRISLVACLSSFTTATVILLLIGQRHDNTMATILNRLRGPPSSTSSGPTSACPAPHPQECSQHCATPDLQEYFPRTFVLDPWKYPLYGRNETPRETGWWGSLSTPNGGFLMVEDQNHETQGYGVSMFHQLHCLVMVRSMLMHGGMDHQMHMHNGHARDEGKKDATEQGHWLHCFDYIAQAILCAADDTLETEGKVAVPGGGTQDGISGAGDTHMCRNATALYNRVLQSEKVPVKASSLGTGRMSALSSHEI
ncbi:hypothetical protein EV127DRAFT_415468 [Xylaria flabelliformis]|nr:hypothetical protein EV127DRAFT_415468 [Xylaria flabelliformis]